MKDNKGLQSRQRARKEYICDSCNRIIGIGELYWKGTGEFTLKYKRHPGNKTITVRHCKICDYVIYSGLGGGH